MNLKDTAILVTGGSSGLGKAMAQLLIEKGAQVAITGRDEEKVKRVAEAIGAFPICADVANTADVERTYYTFMEKFGKLDALINNAGIGGGWTEIDEFSMETMQEVYAVNVFGAAAMANQAAIIFKKQNYGNIVNIASTAGLKGFGRGTVYASSKFALRGMTQCWQAELRKYNVRVILVNPSEVPTAFGNPEREEKPNEPNKLTAAEIAHATVSALEMDSRGFIPELSVWATNPF
jgi:3-oxoacyl-[acyl-carrier protein] reductase